MRQCMHVRGEGGRKRVHLFRECNGIIEKNAVRTEANQIAIPNIEAMPVLQRDFPFECAIIVKHKNALRTVGQVQQAVVVNDPLRRKGLAEQLAKIRCLQQQVPGLIQLF